MRDNSLIEWQSLWTTSKKGRFTYSIKPTVSENMIYSDVNNTVVQNEKQRKLLTRASSGHFPTNSYLHWIKKINSNKCYFCPNTEDNLLHRIIHCPRHAITRYNYLNQQKFWRKEIPNTVDWFLKDWDLIPLTITILSFEIPKAPR